MPRSVLLDGWDRGVLTWKTTKPDQMRPEGSSGKEGVGGGPDGGTGASGEIHERWSDLLDDLERGGRLTRSDVRAAMEKHPRWRFLDGPLSERELEAALRDSPVAIGEEQTISAPHMVAILAEAADVRAGERCLEIGAGSGWLAAILAELVGDEGYVVGVEIVPELVELARSNLAATELRNVEIILGDGSLGHPEGGPYDAIIVSCGAPSVPEPLKEQLAIGGRLVIPVGRRGHQRLIRVTRTEHGFEREDRGGCAFVPLVGQHGF